MRIDLATPAWWRAPLLTSVTTLLAGLLLVAPAVVYGHGGHGDGMQYGHESYFDPDNIVVLSGTLTRDTGDWDVWGHGNHTGGGMAFEMSLGNGDEVELMLAPEWFLADNGIILVNGEQVTVTGSRVAEYDGGRHHGGGNGGHGGGGMMGGDDDADYVIVSVLEADGVVLPLRDEQGYPFWRGGEGWDGHAWFDPDTITTLTGTLDEFLGMWSAWGHGNHTGNGMHYMFAADTGGSFYAMLGPEWYLEREGVTLQAGADVELTGSIVDSYWMQHGDQRFFVATAITVDGKTVQLRDEWGYPLWQGTGWSYYSPEWSSRDVSEIAGTVRRIRHRRNGRDLDKGYEVVLRTGNGKYTLFVAPDWAVNWAGMKLRKGEQITVRGSLGNRRQMVVQHIEANGVRWRFRTPAGLPMWIDGAR
jgi:hypothetical protein